MGNSENQVSVAQVGISDWVAGLAAMSEREFTLKNVQDYIIAHAVKPETMEKYLYFSKGELHTQPDFQERHL